MISSLRSQLRRLTLFLGVMLALLHGPVELMHHAFHARMIAAHAQNLATFTTSAEPCPLCALAALPLTLSAPEHLLSEPCTQPILVCRLLCVEEGLRRSTQRFDRLRAPPALTC